MFVTFIGRCQCSEHVSTFSVIQSFENKRKEAKTPTSIKLIMIFKDSIGTV